MKKSEFYSTSEAAKLLGVSRVTIFLWIKDGKLKAQKIGRNFAIRQEMLLPFLKNPRLSDQNKVMIDKAIRKTVQEYGETLKLLANA